MYVKVYTNLCVGKNGFLHICQVSVTVWRNKTKNKTFQVTYLFANPA